MSDFLRFFISFSFQQLEQKLAEMISRYKNKYGELPSSLNDSKDKNDDNRESILNYFRQHKIKSITLQGDSLVNEYQNSTTETKSANSSPELQQVKSYAESLGKSKLSLSDLEQSHNPSNSPKSNKVLYIGLAIVGLLVVVEIKVVKSPNSLIKWIHEQEWWCI